MMDEEERCQAKKVHSLQSLSLYKWYEVFIEPFGEDLADHLRLVLVKVVDRQSIYVHVFNRHALLRLLEIREANAI